jgi:active breakpoint cluster region-related protein
MFFFVSRPPPKFPRRAAPNFIEPPTVPSNASPPARRSIDKVATSSSTSSSLERNIKPSELFRQKSSDSLDVKLAAINNRKTEPVDMSKFSKSSDLAGEFEKKLAKSESMKSNQSSTGSLSGVTASPTGSLDKASHAKSHVMTSSSSNNNDSPTGSLDKASCKANISTGSRESLASGGIIDGRIKSYESISSLSSDSIKVSGGGGGSAGGHHQGNEPYYDTVPMDNNGDGEYVYIQSGGNGSSSSRDDISMAGSTLPLPRPRSQTSVHVTEPESPGRSPNYANLNYFLQ